MPLPVNTTQASYTPLNSVSETMASIRFLFNKHMKKFDLDDKPIKIDPMKLAKSEMGYDYRNPITLEMLLSVIKQLREAKLRYSEIAKAHDMSITTVLNIKNKKRSYAGMPDDEEQIKAWFNSKKGFKYALPRRTSAA